MALVRKVPEAAGRAFITAQKWLLVIDEPLTKERRGGRDGGGSSMPARRVSLSRQQPWNKGLLVGQKKPLEPKHVWSIRVRLEIAGSKRDLAIFNLAIDSKLRACDLVNYGWTTFALG